jgi:phage terminase large subunit-like protein
MQLTPSAYVQHHIQALSDYISSVTGGTVVCGEYEKLAVDRFLSFKHQYTFKESEFKKFLKFCSLINLPLDNQVQQVHLLGWELLIAASLYCLYKDEQTRVHDLAYIEIGKKQGKTTLCAICSLYDCLFDNELNSQVLFVACSKDQASIALNITKLIIENSPAIEPYFLINKNLIYNKKKGELNRIEVKASDAKLVQGNGVSLSIVDEFAFAEDSELQNKIKSGQIARTNPLQIIITTACNDKLASPAYSLRETCCNILKGEVANSNIFTIIFSLDDKSEVERPECWRKANPSLGHTVKIEALQREYESAKLIPEKLQTFLTDNLNFWTDNLIDTWIADDIIKELMRGNKEIPVGSEVYLGYDGSSNRDLASIAVLYYDQKNDEFISKVVNIFPNNENKRIRAGSIDLSRWIDEGYIVRCQTPVLDEQLIKDILYKLNSTYKIRSWGFDPWNSRMLANQIESETNIPCTEVRQHVAALSFPLRVMETYIMNTKFFMERNPVVRWNFQNVKLYADINNNRKIDKRKGEAVDSIVALNIAMHEWLAHNYDKQSVILAKFNF